MGPIYRKGYFVVIRSYYDKHHFYYTVVNTRKHTHCHVNGKNIKAAKVMCCNARKHKIPEHYPNWMKEGIKRIL